MDITVSIFGMFSCQPQRIQSGRLLSRNRTFPSSDFMLRSSTSFSRMDMKSASTSSKNSAIHAATTTAIQEAPMSRDFSSTPERP